MSVYAKRESSVGKWVWGGVIGLAVALALGGMAYYKMTHEALDKETLCPSSGPIGQYVVLIDNTSPFPFTQKAALSQRLKTMVLNDVPEGHLLSVFLLGENFEQNEKPIFERCNPGQWSNRNQLTATKKFVDRDFNEKFAKPLDAVVRHIPLDEHSKLSPIFQMLQLVGINGFDHANVKGDRKLVIYSDMLANMPDFSMYKGAPPSYADFAKSPYGRNAQAPGLNGAVVVINLLANEKKTLQTNRLGDFWANYFEANGASVEAIAAMEGL
ncbi:hypothetical protein D3C81_55230 [compost metagenome]|jgi:hypothetical protein